ncbi:hypothetical protein DAPPUDRAFT_299977 [Daphnia pulex]|uniref:Dihydrolipoamide acetyltransferase component of pyruvate dehydrogenase complex n=1 Tax=Daphnia pulex TaxID=6669 RepID=E9FRJ3_DAPPU|nr:hypothetical protein DAPPUDRAFT_299977 [Daphnia pulex]|eukprot:EFX90186.1 hypothetical protein DAPPUDRAFT_299977 [Daphnia pulex]
MASFTRIRACDYLFHLNVFRSSFKKNGNLRILGFHSSAPKHVIELKMPSLSPTMTSGTIVNWHKKEGETVSPGDVLCEIQTDKAVMAFETEEEGVLAKIYVGDDSSDVQVGSLIALLAESGEDWKNVKSSETPKISSEVTQKSEESKNVIAASHQPEGNSKKSMIMGPAVRGLLQRYGLSPNNILVSGPRGLLLKGDVLQHIQKENLKPVPISPVAKPIISSKTVVTEPKTAKPATVKVQNLTHEQEYQDLELSSMRRTIAKRLTASKTGIAHAYNTVSCKVDSVINLRQKFKNEGIKFSINDIVIKAVATALDLCPDVNVIWKGDQLIKPATVDISVAVATNSGLITPIVTDVLGRGVLEIGDVVRDLADRARIGKLQLHEFQGGSFTISNLGMYGISEFSAIINPPQCAILAVGGSRLELGDDGKPMTVMSATLSYDEEAISPVAAATFMSTLRSLLESPQSLLLGHRSLPA